MPSHQSIGGALTGIGRNIVVMLTWGIDKIGLNSESMAILQKNVVDCVEMGKIFLFTFELAAGLPPLTVNYYLIRL